MRTSKMMENQLHLEKILNQHASFNLMKVSSYNVRRNDQRNDTKHTGKFSSLKSQKKTKISKVTLTKKKSRSRRRTEITSMLIKFIIVFGHNRFYQNT